MNSNRPIILGSYSPYQNGIIVHPKGIALCICVGAKGNTFRVNDNAVLRGAIRAKDDGAITIHILTQFLLHQIHHVW